MSEDRSYSLIGTIIGGLAFLAAWGYAIATYGFFLGVGLGWIPAIAIGGVTGFLWPFALLAALALLLQ